MFVSDFVRLVAMLQKLKPAWLGTPDQLLARQDRRLRQLLTVAKSRSPFHARRLAGIDIARCALSDLPTLTKSDMMNNLDDVFTDRRLRRRDLEAFIGDMTNLGTYYLGEYGVSHTSGSQGQPSLIVQDKDALMLTFVVQFARGTPVKHSWVPHVDRLWSPPARMAVITQQPGFYPSGAAFAYVPEGAKPFFEVRRLSVFDAMADNVAKLNAFQPNFITGYASALEQIAREEEAGRLQLRPAGALRQITNVAEPLAPETAAWMSSVFGLPISNHYAMGECMAMTSSCACSRGVHVNSDLAILEVVDDDNRPVPAGTLGSRVLMTNLYNQVQPIIRYEVDDRVLLGASACACGSVLPKIESIEGRSKDKFWIEVGGEIRELPYYVFLAALHNYLDLAEHQVLQTGHNTFVIRVVAQPGRTLSAERVRSLVLQSVQAEGLASVIHFDVEIVPVIERTLSGKVARMKNLFGPPPAGRADSSVSELRSAPSVPASDELAKGV